MNGKRNGKLWNMKEWLTAIVIVAMLVIFVPVGNCNDVKQDRKNDVKTKGELVIKLLNEQYHDKFAIADGHFIWATDAYQFTAYPVNEPDFKFSVLISRLSKSGISCSYLFLKLSNDLEKKVKPYIDALTDKNFFWATSGPDIDVCGKDSAREIQKYIGHNLITSNDILFKKYPYRLKNITSITYCYDVTEENKEKIAKDIYNLLCFYREKKFGIIQIHIAFFEIKNFFDKNFKNAAKHSPGDGYINDTTAAYPYPNYKAYAGFSIFEKYSDLKKMYLPTRYGNNGTFTDTDRIITNYKDIEKRIKKLKTISK